MKKLIFVHDGPLFYDEDGHYYEFAYHELLERYSYLAGKIEFMMRTKPIEGTKKFTPVPREIEIISVPNFKSPSTVLKNRRKAKNIIEKHIAESDYVVLRTPSSIAQLAVKYIKKYNKPYMVESVGCSWDSYWNHSFLGKIVAPYMYLSTRKMIAKAEFVIYVTTGFLQKRYPSKGETASCSDVVLDEMDDGVLEKRLQKIRKFNPKEKLVLGTAAAIDTRYKGQEYVIRAIPCLVKMGYNVEYHLAGGITGQKENTFLRDLAEKIGVLNRVVFRGNISADEMNRYYDEIDIYVQPSKQEGLSRAVIEALSRGCPCIGSDIAGNPELIQPKLLFKKGSHKEVVKTVSRILEMDLSEIATRNFEKARDYDKTVLDHKRKAFYDKFLAKYGGD